MRARWDDQRVMPPHLVAYRFGEEPKPCPFCNSTAVGMYLSPSPHMTCGSCGADGPAFECSREYIEERQAKAFRAWNGAMPRQPVFKPGSI